MILIISSTNFKNACRPQKYPFKGAEVDDPGKVKIEFSVVFDRGECQLPDAF